MKKLLIMLLILTTFLFITSYDKDAPTDESSSETSKVEETTIIEETTTVDETTTVEATSTAEETSTDVVEETSTDVPEISYYETVVSEVVHWGYEWKAIYTDYQEFVNEIAEKHLELKDNFNEQIFESNYLVVQSITVTTSGYSVIGYYDFSYNEEDKTMSVYIEMDGPDFGDKISPGGETFCDVLIIPKELFPTNMEDFPNEVQIKFKKAE